MNVYMLNVIQLATNFLMYVYLNVLFLRNVCEDLESESFIFSPAIHTHTLPLPVS